MKGLVIVGVLAMVSAVLGQYPENCGECDPSACPKAVDCVAGTVLDRCDCCEVCAKSEFELCDHHSVQSPNGFSYGKCGENLQCRLRDDLDSGVTEAICYCSVEGTLCGSDEVTYDNICQLMAGGVRKREKVTVSSKGPCKSAPKIISKPDNAKDKIGANVAISCEASGYPIPTVEWTWTRVDGKTIYLPSDDLHISVNMRGGPEKWQITGWLQIMDLTKGHEGDYTCVVQNEFGVTEETARVIVVDDDEHEQAQMRHHKKKHNKNHRDSNKH